MSFCKTFIIKFVTKKHFMKAKRDRIVYMYIVCIVPNFQGGIKKYSKYSETLK